MRDQVPINYPFQLPLYYILALGSVALILAIAMGVL
jgi:hypothetical protein